MKFLLLVAAVFGGIYYYYSNMGFTDDDIDSIKRQIKAEYEKKSTVKVDEVMLLKKSARELSGYAKVRHTDINLDQTLRCTAEMGQDRSGSYWRCGR